MAIVFGLLALVASIVSLVCAIMVLIKLFQDKGVGWGIFGIFCGIYTFIWGWQNVARHNIKNIMLIWSVALVANIVLQIIAGAMSASTVPAS
jgi:multisubunit Na+/H+ antiporter MnhG subunit